MFTEYLLCARHCSRHWGPTHINKTKSPSSRSLHSSRDTDSNQIKK